MPESTHGLGSTQRAARALLATLALLYPTLEVPLSAQSADAARVFESPEASIGETSAALHWPAGAKAPWLLAAGIRGVRIAIASSIDGGAHWRTTLLPLTGADVTQIDPYVAWGPDGTAWIAVIGHDGAINTAVRVLRSTDQGLTWTLGGTASGAQKPVDKPALWLDNSPASPFKGTAYALWHSNGVSFTSFRRAAPGSKWSKPRRLSGAETTGNSQGGDVRSDASGALYAAWPDQGIPGTASDAFWVARSTNGGKTFAAPARVAGVLPGSTFIITPAHINTRLAALATDRRGGKAWVFLAWTEVIAGATCTPDPDEETGLVQVLATSDCVTRIVFTRSPDGGRTWDPPRPIAPRPGKMDQFNSALAVDPKSGRLALVFHDTVGDAERKRSRLWLQTSANQGRTWSAARTVSAATSENIWEGHYIGVAAASGWIFAAWTAGEDQLGEFWGAVIHPN